MKKPILLLLSIFFTFSFAFSQNKSYTVTGKLIEKSSGLPLEFATVSFTEAGTNNIVTGGITNMDGEYTIDVQEGVYDIRFEYIAYTTVVMSDRRIDSDTRLPSVSLEFSAQALDEVVVRAETTEVQVRLDKKIYNIGKDLTTRGATVGDALSNVPSVNVDVDGAISLRGNQNVRILINGKPSGIAGFGDTDVLTRLPAESIERVEVITSPSARYDAEGTAGILNIILRKEKTLGFNGSISGNTGYPDNHGINANLNLRTDNFNIFNNTGFSYRKAPGNAFFNNTFENGQFSQILEDRDYDRMRSGFNTNLGIEVYLNDHSSIIASGSYRNSDSEDETETFTRKFNGNTLDNSSLRREDETETDERYSLNLNYINNFDQSGQKLTVDFQFQKDKENTNSFITERTVQPTENQFPSEDILSGENQEDILFQADYVLPIGENAQFEAGYRGNFENEVTDYQLFEEDAQTGEFVLNELRSNIFDYTENVNAFYSQYGNKFGKFSFLLGLRLENTRLKGRLQTELTEAELDEVFGVPIQTNFNKNYLGLFPTVNIIYELNERENITLGYNRRINRPRGWFINPFPSRSSVTNVFQGNPDLDPAYASAFDLGYVKRWQKITLTSSVYFQHETDAFERVQRKTGETINGVDVVQTLPINLATNQRIGAEAGILYNPLKWLRLNGSFNFFRFETEGEFDGVDYGATNTSWFTRFSAKVSLPAKIDWQTNMFYNGPSENSQTKTEGMFSANMAISKDLFNENASIALNVSDLFNSRIRRSFTNGDGFTSDSEFQWRERQITLSFTYRFNQKKRDRQQRRGNGDDFEEEFQG